MLDSVWTQRACGKDLERLAVKERRAWIFRLLVQIVSESFQAVLKILLGVCCADLQMYATSTPTRRQGQALHDRLCSRHQKHAFFRPGETPQHRASPAGDLARRF